MKFTRLNKLTLLLSFLGLQTFSYPAFAFDSPRLFVWGMGGSEAIGRVDALLPIFSNQCDSLFYGDIQGQIGSDEAKYYGLGLGYRKINCSGLFGSYLFYDQNYSQHRHHFNHVNHFDVINPGVEYMGCKFEARVNGYFPTSRREKRSDSFFADVHDTCGVNVNTDQSVFIGHQQFINHFHEIEEVGPGADAELGLHFACAHDLRVYGGGYYYHLDNFDDIKGAEARAVLPVNGAFALTAEASYDNQQHGAVIAGVRIQLGHNTNCPLTLHDKLYDPVARNLGNVKSGSGIPIEHGKINEGLSLFRDNIFFFTGTGGTVFDGTGATGTFENPLAANQFTQVNVDGIDAIADNANLFFNTGTYIINPPSPDVPNARIILPDGQSIFGRSADFRNSAVGAERPLFLGGLDLTGNNRLDSIILTNEITSDGTTDIDLNTLDIEDAENIFICNSVINGLLTIEGNNSSLLEVSSVYANNSEVTIHDSIINATTTITGSNFFGSLVTGIGGNGDQSGDRDFVNNLFTLKNVTINSNAIIEVDNLNGVVGTGFNFVTAIGGNAFGGSANFTNNIFDLDFCTLNSTGSIGRDMPVSTLNYVTAIGGNADAAPNNVGTAVFENNLFSLNACVLDSNANVGRNGHFSVNSATAIGGNAFRTTGNASFNFNTFTVDFSDLNSEATYGGTVVGSNANFATVIGGNQVDGIANFTLNNFIVNFSTLNSLASIAEDQVDSDAYNFATVIGGNGAFNTLISDAVFQSNTFTVNSSKLNSIANIGNNNTTGGGSIANNFASVIGGNSGAQGANSNFEHNLFNLSLDTLSALAKVGNNNVNSLNFAAGIGGNAAAVGGATSQFVENIFNVDQSIINSTAQVGVDNNNSFNAAIGIGGNDAPPGSADFIFNVLNVNNTTVNVLATIGGNNGATSINQAIGWESASGVANLFFDQFFVTATRGSGTASIAIGKVPNATIVNDATTTYVVVAN